MPCVMWQNLGIGKRSWLYAPIFHTNGQRCEQRLLAGRIGMFLFLWSIFSCTAFGSTIFKDSFQKNHLDQKRWRVINPAKEISIRIRQGQLLVKGSILEDDAPNVLLLPAVSLRKGSLYLFSIWVAFSGKAYQSSSLPSGRVELNSSGKKTGGKRTSVSHNSPPKALFGFLNLKKNRGVVFNILPRQAIVGIRATDNNVFQKVKEIQEGSTHLYTIIYDTRIGRAKFYLDHVLVFNGKAAYQDLVPALVVTRWEGKGKKEITSALFDDVTIIELRR